MFLSLLLNNPMIALVWIVVIFMALTVHEFSHALIATKLGDSTAEQAGRLTLNPAKHIDPYGLIPLLLLGFGWAKPVPFNPYNLQHPKRDAVLIAFAGHVSNLCMALVAGIILRTLDVVGAVDPTNLLVIFLVLTIVINLFLLFFNLIPVHPLDGSKLLDALLVKPEQQRLRRAIEVYGPQVLFGLIIISLLTNFDVFFFVSAPSYAVCDLIAGGSCTGFLSLVF